MAVKGVVETGFEKTAFAARPDGCAFRLWRGCQAKEIFSDATLQRGPVVAVYPTTANVFSKHETGEHDIEIKEALDDQIRTPRVFSRIRPKPT